MIGNAEIHPATRQDSSNHSGVSWAAIFAGATAAAALSLLLLMLGSGLGLGAVSPWPGEGVSAKALGIGAILWLALTQILASGMGGYLAGRLRVKWSAVHGDEVYFRDTAHGLLAWAVATLLMATLALGAFSGLVGTGIKAGTGIAAATSSHPAEASPGDSRSAYFIDLLFRDDRPAAVSEDAAHAVATRILVRSLGEGQLIAEDRSYLAQMVSQRTNLSRVQAEQRVDQVYAQARQAVDNARQAAEQAAKATAWSTLWLFIALLIGAFFASLAATVGGRQREGVVDRQDTDYPARTAPLH